MHDSSANAMAPRRLQNHPGKARRLLSVPHPHATVGGPRGILDLHPDTLPSTVRQAFSLSKAVGRYIALAGVLPAPLFRVPPELMSLRSPAGSAWQIIICLTAQRRRIAEHKICIYIPSIFHVTTVIFSSIFRSFLPRT